MGDLEEERRELRARAQRHRGGHDEAECKHDDAQADQDAAELALTRVRLAHEEEAGADENQERRQYKTFCFCSKQNGSCKVQRRAF